MSVVVCNVYVVYCNYIKPPHDKISLCVCASSHYFFWFNSNPASHGIAQLGINAGDHPAISKVCYLDLSGVRAFAPTDIASNNDRGPISAALKARILAALANPIKLLPEKHRQLALTNLA